MTGFHPSPCITPFAVTVDPPAEQTFNANTALIKDNTFNALTGVANTTEFITTTSAHGLSDGDKVQYLVAAGNTAITGIVNGTSYFVVSSNTTALQLALTAGGANLNLTAGVSGNVDPENAAADIIYFKGSYNKEFAGLHKIITNSGTIFNIDASEFDLFKGNEISVGTNAHSGAAFVSFEKIEESIALCITFATGTITGLVLTRVFNSSITT